MLRQDRADKGSTKVIELTHVYGNYNVGGKIPINRHAIAWLESCNGSWQKECGCFQQPKDMTIIHFSGGGSVQVFEDIETVKKLARIKK